MINLEKVDPEIAKFIEEERSRQARNIKLIASESFVSQAIMETAGSCCTNKYAEGYLHHRYYGGCEVVDNASILETIDNIVNEQNLDRIKDDLHKLLDSFPMVVEEFGMI